MTSTDTAMCVELTPKGSKSGRSAKKSSGKRGKKHKREDDSDDDDKERLTGKEVNLTLCSGGNKPMSC